MRKSLPDFFMADRFDHFGVRVLSSRNDRGQYIRPILLTLFLLSGGGGLIYQVVWMRMLGFAMGSTVLAVSTVLTAFMAGLALGSFSFGRLIDRRADALKVYAYLEIGIGLCGLAMPTLLLGLSPIYVGMTRLLSDSYAALSLARFGLCFVLLVIPTTLMGGTLPVLSKFFVARKETLGWNIGALYAVNTLGAVIGCFAAGFVLIGTMGVVETVYIAAVLNLLVAAGTLVLRAVAPDAESGLEAEPAGQRQEQRPRLPGLALLILCAFGLSGFAALGYEVIWSRILVFFVGNSTYAFSAMLTTFLLGLALGSFVAGKLADRRGDLVGAFGVMEILIGLSALVGMVLLRGTIAAEGLWVMQEQTASSWYGEIGKMFKASFAVMFVPTLFMGATFPLASKAYVRSVEEVGRDIGAVYSVNTLGAILGAFISGFAILSWLGVQGAIIFLAAINAVVGLVILLVNRTSTARLRFVVAPLLGAAVFITSIFLPSRFMLPSDFEGKEDAVLFYQEDRAGTVKVYRKPDGHLLISVDGNTIGDTRDDLDAKQRLLAHLPLLLAPDPEAVLVVGLGSGITVGAMTLYEEVELIDCVEIVPGVVEGAKYFEAHNRDVLNKPQVSVAVADGINYLLTSDRKYDVISSDAKLNPAYTGNAVFLSSDYYRLCLERLSEDGMMVQWIPLHLPQDSYRMVLRTFAEVFPYGTIWFFPGKHTILIGTRHQLEIDLVRLWQRLQRPEVRGDLARFGLDHPLALLSGYRGKRADILRYVGRGELSSWNHPYIEFQTPQGLALATGKNQASNLRGIRQIRGDIRSHLTTTAEHEFEQIREHLQRYVQSTELLIEGLAQAQESGLLSYGEAFFRQILRSHPEDRRAQYWLARSMRERRDVQEATAGVRDARAYIVLGNTFLTEGAFTKALEAFARATEIEPENAVAHYHLGVVSEYNDEGQRYGPGFARARAIAAYEKAISIQQDYVEAHYNLGVVCQYNEEGKRYGPGAQVERASAIFKRVVEMAPTHAAAHNNLGAIYFHQQLYTKARAAWEQALKGNPNLRSAHINLGLLDERGW